MKKIFLLGVLIMKLFFGPESADCAGANVFVFDLKEDSLEVMEISPAGETVSKPYSSNKKDWIPVHVYQDYILFGYIGSEKLDKVALYDIKQKKFEIIPDTADCVAEGFIKNSNLAIYTRTVVPDNEYRIEFYDYIKKRVVKILAGYGPSCSIFDDIVYFISSETIAEKDGNPKEYRHLNKYDVKADSIRKVQSIELGDYFNMDVTEVVGLSKDFFCYRISDEHEYRYYYHKDKEYPFYSGGQGHMINGNNKEQFDLRFSDSGFAAFFERDWNSLTYLVVVDLEKKQRTETKYYGAYPFIKDATVYFMSDPSFITTDSSGFRQIEKFELFSYDCHTHKLKKIKSFKGHAEVVKSI